MIFHLEKWVDGRPVTACGEVAKGFELTDVPLRVTCGGCAKFIVRDPTPPPEPLPPPIWWDKAPSSSEPTPIPSAASATDKLAAFDVAVDGICRVAPVSRHAVIREVLQSLVFGPEKHVVPPASFSEMVRAIDATPAEVEQAKKTLARVRNKRRKKR